MLPAFECESERGPFVQEVEKRNEKWFGDKIYGGSFARFFSLSADSGGSQRTGKCMYIKHGEIKGISLAAQSRAVAEGGETPVSPRGSFVPEVLMHWIRWYDCVSCAFRAFFKDEKRKQDKGLASEPTLCPITSARSAGS